MKRSSPEYPSDLTPLSPCNKQFSVSNSSPVFNAPEVLESEFVRPTCPKPIFGKVLNSSECAEKSTNPPVTLLHVSSTSNLTTGILITNFVENGNVTISSSKSNTSAQNCASEKIDKVFLAKKRLEECCEGDGEESVFKSSRVDSKKYQAVVPEIPMGTVSDLNVKTEEVRTRWRFEAKDPSHLEIVSNFLQFAQRLSNEWASEGGSGP